MARKATKLPIKKKKATKRKSKAKKSIAKTGEVVTPLATLREEVDNIFDRFAEDWPSLPKLFGKGWTYPIADLERHMKLPNLDITPRVDVSESDDSYDIAVELPGMTEKDIELTLSDDSLTLKGEKKIEREEKKKNYHVSERSYGSFQRTFRVPNGVDHNQVEASYSKGVLNVSLPKTEIAKSNKRSIEVKAD
ncbi:MAG: Hsp20/alpha crystallin family protein [Gammaproteobacteria bacterium]|nr:Hsp20/alpha crystallin family protein [Gammaproteobacteria bacterium]